MMLTTTTTTHGKRQSSLHKDIYAGIVTSLYFFNETLLLVGHGPYLKIYNVHTGALLVCEHALPANRIHRIVPVEKESTETCKYYSIYGSKTMRLIHVTATSENQASISLGHAYQFADWIMDMCWLDSGEHLHIIKSKYINL
ncbi:hypothetical protein BDA99DRAFT_100104 [Phascolomyces articulosus]|uniref:Uncharacterized protein n=1 Tax=Phascolomyces articulosus TaxID=60185 RepID=A0AAD5KAA5_9FUNG|nr:hypothetical protein BDA99DRAFT_100104 [Phascolomyces articulosus]